MFRKRWKLQHWIFFFLVSTLALAGVASANCSECVDGKGGGTGTEKAKRDLEKVAAAVDPDLLPSDRNPVEAGVSVSAEMKALFANFDTTAGEKRHYDWVSPLDGVTFGMGHWPQIKVGAIFQLISQDQKTMPALMKRAVEFFQAHPEECRALGVLGACSSQAIAHRLQSTLFSANYMKRFGKNCKIRCKDGQADFFHEHSWFKGFIRYAFRDRKVVEWQVRYYEQTMVEPAKKLAAQAGVPGPEGTVMLASLRSTAPAWASAVVKQAQQGTLSATAKKTKKKLVWDVSGSGPKVQKKRLLAIWQWYNNKKGYLRTRSKTFYCQHLVHEFPNATFNGDPSEKSISCP